MPLKVTNETTPQSINEHDALMNVQHSRQQLMSKGFYEEAVVFCGRTVDNPVAEYRTRRAAHYVPFTSP
jgi:hypothetical protein